ncbi:MAG TPA: DNA mismatch repair endonuclease MutL [Polyangiaceae bacterium]|nr:DNA mismatch repair endonuclease MutL [Polyangiaceae bacterium]
MSPGLASQIAAGEVVERPSSAVKELLENAVDAGATRIDVEIAGGGITLISVSDDGVGMGREDARLSVERHATSKLFSFAELSRVTTYGFRGEALPSIASVSRVSIRTRTRDDDAGTHVVVEGGAAASVRPAGAPVGTTVEVRDLFYNVPARRKFLRSSGTESGHVSDVLEAAALARYDLTITLTRDGRRVREWLRAESREERVRTALGDGLATCTGRRGPLAVEAFLSRPEDGRSGAAGLRLMVNGRPVRDRAMLHTIAQAYGSVLERGRYPRGVVYVDLPPELVDVNVHPQKAEVRFADPRAVTDAVYHLLSVELARAFSLPAPSRSPWTRPATPPPMAPLRAPDAAIENPTSGIANDGADARAEDDGKMVQSADAVEAERVSGAEPLRSVERARVLAVADSAAPLAPSLAVRWASLRFIAQVRQTYLICEGHDGLYVIDQHAAAERVNYDRLRKQLGSRAIPSQSLLFPQTLEVLPAEVELVETKAEAFASLGVELRVRGTNLVSVHSVPKILSRASPERLVRDLLTELSRAGGRAFSDALDLALATMACHGSIRAGDKLTEGEASALLAALDVADFAGHCPHGRPVVAVTTWNELERKVGRR